MLSVFPPAAQNKLLSIPRAALRLLDEVLSQCLYTVHKAPSSLYHVKGGRQFLSEFTGSRQTMFNIQQFVLSIRITCFAAQQGAIIDDSARRHTCILGCRKTQELRNFLHNSRNVAPGCATKWSRKWERQCGNDWKTIEQQQNKHGHQIWFQSREDLPLTFRPG